MTPYLPLRVVRTPAAPTVPNCHGFDDDTMFPDPKELPSADYAAAVTFAKYVCDGCPILTACLGGALQRGEKHGVWGGKTPEERADLLAGLERLAAAAQAEAA